MNIPKPDRQVIISIPKLKKSTLISLRLKTNDTSNFLVNEVNSAKSGIDKTSVFLIKVRTGRKSQTPADLILMEARCYREHSKNKKVNTQEGKRIHHLIYIYI